MDSLSHFIYVAEGFMEDCDMLIHSLTEKYEKVDWPKFCEHWKELQFDLIFYGRLNGAELVELTEECFQCARLYMVTESDNYEDQVIGIFIAYAISQIQPYRNLCFLRLTPEDVAPLKKVEAIARKDKRTDVLMILGRLYVYCAQYHVSTRERAMDYGIRKYYDGTIRVPKTIYKQWKGQLNRNNIRKFEKISEREKKYMESKNRLKLKADSAYPGFNVLVDTAMPIAEDISQSLQKLILSPKKEKQKDEDHSAFDIKMRALKNTVNPMRHLTGIEERKTTAESLPPTSPAVSRTETPTKSVRSKIKENSQNVIARNPIKQNTTKKTESNKDSLMYSLPSLEGIMQEPNANFTRVDTPEEPFRGFTAEEIARSNASLSNSDLDDSPVKKRRKRNSKVSPKSTAITLDLDDTSNTQKGKQHKKPPQSTFKINNNKTEIKKGKKTVKINKNTVTKLFGETDSSTHDGSFDFSTRGDVLSNDNDRVPNTEEISKTYKTANTKNLTEKSKDVVIDLTQNENKGVTDKTKSIAKNLVQKKEKGVTDKTKGKVKVLNEEKRITDKTEGIDVIQYEIDDIIIHADKDLPELEIELIDQYTEPVNNHETEEKTTAQKDISEHDQVPKNNNSDIKNDDNNEETVEVVRILTETEAAVIQTKESLVVPRRKRKRPGLQSRFRKMGILPVANFYNDDASGS